MVKSALPRTKFVGLHLSKHQTPLLILTVVDAILFTAWVVTLNVQPSLSNQLMPLIGVVIALSAVVLAWAVYEALTYGQ